jgi:tetratricopeptide (TPR) repeat protein
VAPYITRLRRLLQDAAPAGELGVLRYAAGGYRIECEPELVDLHRARRQAGEARAAGRRGDHRSAADLLDRALAGWQAVALAGLRGPWAARMREALQRERLELFAQRAEAELRLGRYQALVDTVRPLLTEHPTMEALAGPLLTALARTGRSGEALRQYAQLRKDLADELGIEPSAPLQQLYLQILRDDGTPDADAPPAPTGPARPAQIVPTQLPAGVGGFTGRTTELAALDALLAAAERGEHSAVVISAVSGMAGVGKTALALHWAHGIRHRFPDGQLYVNLRGHAATPPLDTAQALAQFLRALGTPAEQIPVDLDEAAALYRTIVADKRILVLLDNAANAEQIRPLFPGGLSSLVVVTSRTRLAGLVALDGAHELQLDVLTEAEARILLERILGAERVRAEPAAVDELARRCAYLPLALRISAANLAAHPRHPITNHLARSRAGNRLADLAVPGDDKAAVRTAFDLSHQALTPPAQRLFQRLGLIPGPDFTIEAAAALLDTTTDLAADLMDELVTAYLVDEHAPFRFAFHDLLRLYAAAKADEAEPQLERRAALDRLFDRYLRTADAAARTIYPHILRLPLPAPDRGVAPNDLFDRDTQALAWFDTERVNLLAAVTYAAEHGPRRLAWLLADVMRGYLSMRLWLADWLAAADHALAAAVAEQDQQAQAAANLSLGTLHWMQGAYAETVNHFTRALDLSREAGWVDGEAATLGNIGAAYNDHGQPTVAVDHLAQGLALNERLGRLTGQAVNLANLAYVNINLGRLAEALEYGHQAVALNRRIESRTSEAISLTNIGYVYQLMGRLDESTEYLDLALNVHRTVGNRSWEANTMCALAAVYRDTGRLPQALEFGRATVELADGIGHHRFHVDALNVLATVHCRVGEHQRAIHHHQRALQLARDIEGQYGEADALIGLSVAYGEIGSQDRSIALARAAHDIATSTGYRLLQGQALTCLANAHRIQGSLDEARRYAEEALRIHRETGHRPGEASTLRILDSLR